MSAEPKISRPPLGNAPCRTCPWRKSSDPSGKDIPRFDIEMMRGLRNTVGDGFRLIMGCHYMHGDEGYACMGYIHRDGYDNLNTRLYLRRHGLSMTEINAACEPIEMWESFEAMLAAYKEAQRRA